ncbi:hypothetical protein DPM19_23745 [Actinomadura craniellae]|uniref:Fibronectin type-III domain-containing protein n=1 Tax=Actinomadura craniellae TaxID=2231787 RepID=A0A365H0J5_9ACTN|nr:fibronectin type III domain-containing protein [Actinomadura craniellae]RAY12615.1 hypothetical protein DPM19_23745 [Actinomadura craniellae]
MLGRWSLALVLVMTMPSLLVVSGNPALAEPKPKPRSTQTVKGPEPLQPPASMLTPKPSKSSRPRAGNVPSAPAPSAKLAEGTGQYVGGLKVRVLSNVTIAAGATSTVKVTDVGSVPATGVSTVAVNFAIAGTGGTGGIIAYPSEQATAPGVTGARYRSGVWEDHLLMLKVGTDGHIKVRNTGTVPVAVYIDIHGYFTTAGTAAGSNYVPLPTARIIGGQTIPANSSAAFTATGVGGIPATGVAHVAFTLVVRSTGSGQVMAYPSGTTAPTASNINYRPPDFLSNLVIVPPGSDGKVAIRNYGSTPLTVYADVTGYFADPSAPVAASAATPVTPSRIVNSTPVAAGATYVVAPRGKAGVPATGVGAVGVNLSAASSTASGLLRVHPTGQANVPGGGSIAFQAGTWANFVPVKLGPDGTFTVRNTGSATVNLSVDTFTYFTTPGPPGAPTSVTAAGGDRSATVQWQRPASDGGAAITGYTVTASPGGARVTTDGSTLEATFTGLSNGTAYTFTVTATNVAGTSAPSAASAPVTPAPGNVRPGAPTDVTATPGDATATVRWQKPADGSSPITSYTVTASPGGASVTVNAPALQAQVPGLTNGTSYTFTVVATSTVGGSDPSQPSAAVVPGRVPGAPTNVIASAADRSASITWTAPADTGTSPITKYTVTEVTSGDSVTTAGETWAAFTGLDNGTQYSFRVKATNATGESAWSTVSNTVTPQESPVPGRPFITDTVADDGEVELAWAPPDTGARAVTRYRITVQPGNRTVDTPPETRTATIDGLDNGTEYTFTIVASNANGAGPASLPAKVAPRPAIAPLPPTVLQVLPSGGRVTVRWLPPQDGGSPITGYTLAADPGGAEVTVPGNATEATLTGLTNGTAHTLRLTAINRRGTSTAATTPNVTPAADRVPGQPTNLEATAVAAGQAEISWQPPADPGTAAITEYIVTASPGGRTVTVNDCDPQQPNCTGTLTGLDPDTDYTFTVTARNSAGTGPASQATQPIHLRLTAKATPRNLSVPAANTLTAVRSDGTLVFSSPPAEVTDLTAGQILIAPATPAAPEGLLKKIVKVSTVGTRTVITTTQANLTDFITDGDFTGQVTLDRNDVSGAAGFLAPPPRAGKRRAETPLGPPLHFPLHQSIGSHGRFDADLILRPTLVYNLRIRAGRISGRVAVQNNLSGHIQVTATRQDKWSKQFTLGKWKHLKYVKAGRARIPITLTTSLTANAEARASGKVTFGAKPNVDTGVAAQLDGFRTSWTPFHQDRTTADRPILDGTALARAGLTGDHFVALAGTVGLGAEINSHVTAQADVNANPWWTVRADSSIRGCVSWFDQCTPAGVSRDFSVTLLSADGPFRGLVIEPAHARTLRGRAVDFNAAAFGIPQPQVRWNIVSGPGSIDDNGVYVSDTPGVAVVRATAQSGGLEDPDAEAQIVVDPNIPEAPTDVRATPLPLAAHVSWQPPADTLVGITGYTIVATPREPEHPEVTGNTPASARTFDLPYMEAGVSYDVRVYATNAGGSGPPSPPATVTPNQGLSPEGGAVNAAVDVNGIPDSTGNSQDYISSISADGRYVFFLTTGNSNLMPPEAADPNSSAYYILRKDMETGELVLASRQADGRTPAPVDPLSFAYVTYEGARAGTSVAYVTLSSAGTTDGDLIVNDVDGNSAWLVMDGSAHAYPYVSISLSDTGDSIAYLVYYPGGIPEYQMFHAQRGGDYTLVNRGPGTFHNFSLSMDADGDLITYSSAVSSGGALRSEMRVARISTGTYEVAATLEPNHPTYENPILPKISPDGTTIAYFPLRRDGGGRDTLVKKIPDLGIGTRVGPIAWEAHNLSNEGRFVSGGMRTPSATPQSGIYDRLTGGFLATYGPTRLAHDGSAGVHANTACGGPCPPGVWYQRFHIPRGNLGTQVCNNPDYGSIGQYGRRTGARAKLCRPLPEDGQTAGDRKPPGWPLRTYRPEWKVPSSWPTRNTPGSDNNHIFQRGHLIGKQFGGKRIFSNLVTQFGYSNNNLQNPFEGQIARHIESSGEEIYYYAIPVYSDLDAPQTPTVDTAGGANWVGAFPSKEYPMPNKIHIIAQGTDGYFEDVCIPNTQDRTLTVVHDDPCLA